MDFGLIERLGGPNRFSTLVIAFVHFTHLVFCIANFCYWVRNQQMSIGQSLVTAYLAVTVVGCVFYLVVASVFYMWAWRFPEPEEVAKRRRIYGVWVNLLFCDLPIFVVETKIVWQVKFANGLQGFTFCLTCISICYSIVRVWTFFMVKVIKIKAPLPGVNPRFSITRPYREPPPQYASETEMAPGRQGYWDADVQPEANLAAREQFSESNYYGPSASRYYASEGREFGFLSPNAGRRIGTGDVSFSPSSVVPPRRI